MKTGPKPRPTLERMMEKVVKQTDGCWVFMGAKGSQGYGKTYHEGRATDAHRVSWVLHNGEITQGMVVMHVCDVKACVNPEHLKLGTQADNMRDMTEKMRRAGGKALSDAIKAGWTPEKRQKHSIWLANRRRAEYRQRQIDAGVPFDWKYCPKSKHWVPRTEFGKNAARQDGYDSNCLACRRL